jgi:N-acetylglucosamine-6-phosphate deacetylase
VDVVAGVARVVSEDGTPGAIGAGTARLVDVLRRTVRNAGVALPEAVTAATTTPARLIGLDSEVGDVVPGRRADLLITDADLVPRAVLRAGRWVDGVSTDAPPRSDTATGAR